MMKEGEPSAHILLVEDNPGDVRLVTEAFATGDSESTLHVTKDGIEALEFCHRRGAYEDAPHPDLVVLDLNLPRKHGVEVLEELKSDPDLMTIPVIVLTSSESREDMRKSYERHANAYVTKPVDPTEFIETIQSLETFWLSVVRLPTWER
ncbi:response regulator [Saliphagus sp. GCM10025334]